MFECFRKAILTLVPYAEFPPDQCPPEENWLLIQNCLDLSKACLAFGDKSIFDEDDIIPKAPNFEDLAVPQDVSWQNPELFFNLAESAKRIYSQTYPDSVSGIMQHKALENLVALASVKSQQSADRGRQILAAVMGACTEIFENGIHLDDPSNIHLMCLLLDKLKNRLDSARVQEETVRGVSEAFIRSVITFSLGIFTPENFETNYISFEFLLGFWERFCDFPTHLRPIQPLLQVSQAYMGLCQTVINESPDDAIEAIFGSFEVAPPALCSLGRIARCDLDDFAEPIRGLFSSYLTDFMADSGNPVISTHVSFYAVLTLQALEPKPLRGRSILGEEMNQRHVEISQTFLNLLFKLLSDSKKVLKHTDNRPALMEKCVLFVIENIIKTFFTPVSASRMDDASSENTMLLGKIFNRILATLRYFGDQPFLITTAMLTLFKYVDLSNHEFIKFAIAQFLEPRLNPASDCFAFLQNPANRRSRVMFYKLIATLRKNNPASENLGMFVADIDQRLSALQQSEAVDEYTAGSLMVDIRGLFSATDVADFYSSLFHFYYPRAIEILGRAAALVPSLIQIYLKLLVELTANRKARFMFPQHSADGLKLFKTCAEFLTTYLRSFGEPAGAASNVLHWKSAEYSLIIIYQVLSNENSNLGALEVYEDPALMDLVGALYVFLRVMDEDEASKRPKMIKALFSVFAVLSSNFLDIVVRVEPLMIVKILSFCHSVKWHLDVKYDVMDLLKVLRHTTQFLLDNADSDDGKELLGECIELAAGILDVLEEMILQMKKPWLGSGDGEDDKKGSPDYDVTEIMELVKRLGPPNWISVKARLTLFLGNCADTELRKKLHKLLELPLTPEEMEREGISPEQYAEMQQQGMPQEIIVV